MHFAQHLILSWFVAEGGGLKRLADRRIVTWAGCVPDLDVIPYAGATVWNVAGKGMSFGGGMQHAFETVHRPFHHVWTHGIGFILLTGMVAGLLSRFWQKGEGEGGAGSGRGVVMRVAGLAMVTSLLHCLGDVLASGPRWPIYPFMPFDRTEWGYSWSWTLADWPSLLLLGGMMLAARQYAVWRGRSVVEAFHAGADRWFVQLVRQGKVSPGPEDGCAS